MARRATGADVGGHTVVLLRGQPKGNTFAVTDYVYARNASGTTVGGWEACAGRFKPVGACVGLSGRDVNLRYPQVPRLPDWQLRNLMRFEVQEIGGQAGAEVASDFNVLPEIAEIEGEDVVLLAMAREALLDEHLDGIASVGGKLAHFTPDSIALYNAWLFYGAVEEDTVLLADIGAHHLDVALVRGTDLLYAGNLTGGAELFDRALAERFDVSTERAERIKREWVDLEPGARHGGANQEKASRAVLGAAGQLLNLLQAAVSFCKNQIKLSGLRVDRVLLCGGGAALRGLDRYLAAAMKVPVERFDPFQVVDTSALDPDASDLLDEHRLESVVALGLATGASHPRAYSIEILPERIRRRRDFWGGTALLWAAAALAVVYLGFSAWQRSAELDALRAEVRSLRGRYSSAQRTNLGTQELAEENVALGEVVGELYRLAGSGEQLARFLGVAERELPRDFWIEELECRWGFDAELGIERQDQLPMVFVQGRTREGTESPALQFERLVRALEADLDGLRLKPTLSPSGRSFSLALSTLAADPGGTDDDGGAGDADVDLEEGS